MSPLLPNPLDPLDPLDLDLESQAPVIHDIVTSSPSDNEHLGATPFVTNIDLGAPLDIPASELLPAEPEESCSTPPLTEIPVTTEQALDTPADVLIPAGPAGASPVFTAEPEVDIPTETLTAADPPAHIEADITFTPESTEPPSPAPESLVAASPIDDAPAPETVDSAEAEEEEAAVEEEEMEPSETVTQEEREAEEEEGEGMGLKDCILWCMQNIFSSGTRVIFLRRRRKFRGCQSVLLAMQYMVCCA